MRNLVVVLGDQLSLSSAAFEGFDAAEDRVWMAEVREESEHVPSAQMRTALFLSAMRHFARALTARGMPLDYLQLGTHGFSSIGEALRDALTRHRPEAVLMVDAGEWRLEQAIARTCKTAQVPLYVRDDLHFMASRAEFATHAQGKRRLVMESFYRQMRSRHQVLLDAHGVRKAGSGITTMTTGAPSVGKGRAWCHRRLRSRPTPSPARCWPMSRRTSATTTAVRTTSIGR